MHVIESHQNSSDIVKTQEWTRDLCVRVSPGSGQQDTGGGFLGSCGPSASVLSAVPLHNIRLDHDERCFRGQVKVLGRVPSVVPGLYLYCDGVHHPLALIT